MIEVANMRCELGMKGTKMRLSRVDSEGWRVQKCKSKGKIWWNSPYVSKWFCEPSLLLSAGLQNRILSSIRLSGVSRLRFWQENPFKSFLQCYVSSNVTFSSVYIFIHDETSHSIPSRRPLVWPEFKRLSSNPSQSTRPKTRPIFSDKNQ